MTTVRDLDRFVREGGTVVSVLPDTNVTEAARTMCRQNISCLVVLDADGRLCGIVSERDFIAKIVARGAAGDGLTVGDIMTPNVISCHETTSVGQAAHLMITNNIRHLPIVEGGKVVGIVSNRDMMAHELAAARALASQQSRMLKKIEEQFPGITQIALDDAGRVVI